MQTPTRPPDFHFLYLAPTLSSLWLFGAARLYWTQFRPTVVVEADYISLVPIESVVAVSILSRRDTVRDLINNVVRAFPTAYMDLLTYETIEEARTALDGRARVNQPLGYSFEATPVTPTRQALQPTPGAVIAGTPINPQQGYFITQTPTPAQVPLSPTPGAIQGGG